MRCFVRADIKTIPVNNPPICVKLFILLFGKKPTQSEITTTGKTSQIENGYSNPYLYFFREPPTNNPIKANIAPEAPRDNVFCPKKYEENNERSDPPKAPKI